MRCHFLALTILFLISSAWGARDYTLTDLQILAQEGSYEEFFAHALDVRPSERQEDWKSMASSMADAYTRKVLSKSEINKTDFKQVESLYLWPQLKSDDLFRARRQEIGLIYLSSCLKSSPPCLDELQRFWEANPFDPDTAFKIAQMLSPLPEHPPLWRYLEVALKSPLSEFYCKKELVMNELWLKLEGDYIRLGPKGDLLKKIDEILHPDCLPPLSAEARKRLIGPEKTSDRELAFQILNAQTKIDQRLADFFYTVYLLEQPGQGDLFNYSWNRLKELGAHSSRREAVLTLLKELDPLPDELLNSYDQTKKRVILSHFKAYFPEFLDFYVDQCHSFYAGKGHFPKGNPTVHCQNLMSSDLAPKLIDEWKIKRYQEARKI